MFNIINPIRVEREISMSAAEWRGEIEREGEREKTS